MTIDEFLEKLKETPRTWSINDYGSVRQRVDTRRYTCPICAVAGRRGSMAFAAGRALDMSDPDIEAVILAADLTDADGASQALRARILSACGLSPSGARTT